MEPKTDHSQGSFVLPTIVFGSVEVRRLLRELESLDSYMHQAGLRSGGVNQAALPRMSKGLEQTAEENGFNLLQSDDRSQLAATLQWLAKSAPTLHISFASDPSAGFMTKIVGWLRQNIHPHVLVRLGLQPAITAGCVLRTANKSFDFSLRHRFDEQRASLVTSLETTAAGQPQPAAVIRPAVGVRNE